MSDLGPADERAFGLLVVLVPALAAAGLLAWGFVAGWAAATGKRALAIGLVAFAGLAVVGMAGFTAWIAFVPSSSTFDDELPPSQHAP